MPADGTHLSCGHGVSRSTVMAWRWLVAGAISVASAACGDNLTAPTLQIVDFHRFARFTPQGDAIVYFRHDERPQAVIGVVSVDLATGSERLIVEAILAGLDVHPTQELVIFSARASATSEPDLWTIGLDGTGLQRLTQDGNGHRWPNWSHDGTRLAWEVRRPDQVELDTAVTLWIGDWDGSAVTNAHPIAPGRRSAWRPDGEALAVERRRPGGETPLVVALIDTTGTVLDTLGFGSEPVWRPDGAEIAYLADAEPDRGCVGVCFVSAAGGDPRALSTAYYSFPGSWSRDGLEYAFARHMRTYHLDVGETGMDVEESRLWVRTLATGAERQITF